MKGKFAGNNIRTGRPLIKIDYLMPIVAFGFETRCLESANGQGYRAQYPRNCSAQLILWM